MNVFSKVCGISVAAVLAACAFAPAAKAAMIAYPDISGPGISVTNITETNDATGSVEYYGPGKLSGDSLSINFPIDGTNLFKAAASGPNGSDYLDVKLAFDVTTSSPIPLQAFLSEVGDFTITGAGTGGDFASIMIQDADSNFLAGNTGTYTIPTATTGGFWTNSIGTNIIDTSAPATTTFMHIVIDNVLHVSAPANGDFALIEKKALVIDFGTNSGNPPPIPEPASLGLLGIGALALLRRRH